MGIRSRPDFQNSRHYKINIANLVILKFRGGIYYSKEEIIKRIYGHYSIYRDVANIPEMAT